MALRGRPRRFIFAGLAGALMGALAGALIAIAGLEAYVAYSPRHPELTFRTAGHYGPIAVSGAGVFLAIVGAWASVRRAKRRAGIAERSWPPNGPLVRR